MKHIIMTVTAVMCAASAVMALDGVWQGPDGGAWDEAANWVGGDIAEGSGATAFFQNGDGEVVNDMVDLALLGIELDGPSFTLAGGLITLDPLGFVRVLGGSHAVDLPLALSGDATLEVASGQLLEVGGDISGYGGLAVFGGVVKLSGQNTFSGVLAHRTGTVEVASVDALGAGGLSFGEGTFRYTGPTASMPGYTVNPIATGYAVIFDVTDPNTTLTVAGPVVDGNKAPFIKTGEGTLVFGYDGNQTISGAKAPGGSESCVFNYSADGVLSPMDYPSFGIERGTVIIGGTGRTTDVWASSAFIGVRTLASPTFIIDGGVNRFNNGYSTIGRGTGTRTSPQQPSMYVRNGSYVEVNGSGFVMANQNGQDDFYCEPYLSVDEGSTFRVMRHLFINEHGSVSSRVDVANGSLFQSEASEPGRGLNLPQSGGFVTMTIDSGSTGRTFYASVRDNAKLLVTDKSVLEYDATIPNFATSSNRGLAYFDDATLRQRTPAYQSSWLMNTPDMRVGANGLTIDVAGRPAVLSPVPLQAENEAAGTVTKTGTGELALPTLPALPVQVQEGSLNLYRSLAQMQVPPVYGALSLAPGAELVLAGANSGQGLQLPPSLTLAGIRPYGHHSLWRFVERGVPFADGALQLGNGNTYDNGWHQNRVGAAWLAQRKDVSGAWSVSFDYTCNTPFETMADGVAFVIQNDLRGTAAIGHATTTLGYGALVADTGEVQNSFAVGFDIIYGRVRFGESGAWVATTSFAPRIENGQIRLSITIDSDGAGMVTAKVYSKDFLIASATHEVDIPTLVDDTQAYIGFTGATGGITGQHIIDTVQFDDGSGMFKTPYSQYGGDVALGGSGRFDATLHASPSQKGFGLASLTYAPGATVAVHSQFAGVEPPLMSLDNQDGWVLWQNANWKPDGGLALSGAGLNLSGYANSRDKVAATGPWNARFKFSRGSSSGAPADVFSFSLHNRGTNAQSATGDNTLSVYWRYYDGNRRDTQLRLYTNSSNYIPTTGVTNTVPVDMARGGPVWMDITYDPSAQTLTVIMDQDFDNGVGGVFTNVFENVDVAAILGGNMAIAQVGFSGQVGGQYTENIVSDFSFTTGDTTREQDGPGYLAFNAYNGTGTVVKEGDGEIGLLGDFDRVPSDTAFRLEEGGLRLLRASDEPFGSVRNRSEWVAMPNAGLWPSGDLLACSSENSVFGVITSARRVRVTEPFTARFTFLFGDGSGSSPADAFSMFFHNDPRGPFAGEGITGNAGFYGVQKSFGIQWYFYQGNTSNERDTVRIGWNGWWNASTRELYATPGIISRNTITDIEVKYDPSDKSLVITLSHDGNVLTTHSYILNTTLAEYVQDDFAYLAFGGGTGGERGNMLIRDLALTFDAPVTDKPERLMCAGVEIPAGTDRTITLDTSVTDAPFLINTLTLEDGAALRLRSATGDGQLRFAATTLGMTAGFAPESGTTLVLDGVVGDTITQQGQGVLKLNGTCDTLRIEKGTVALAAPTLSRTTDLSVTTGATLNLDFVGKQVIHALSVDGVAKKGGAYTRHNTTWITGDGILIVTYPQGGTMIMVR